MSDSLRPHGLQHASLLCPPLSPRVYSNSCPLSRWCYLTISCSATPFSICLQPFLASDSFPMKQLFASGSQSIGTSASTSVLPMNIQGWFPLGLTGSISLQFKGLSRVFSSTTAQPSLWFNSHIHTRLLEKPLLWLLDLCQQDDVSVIFFNYINLYFISDQSCSSTYNVGIIKNNQRVEWIYPLIYDSWHIEDHIPRRFWCLV